jgi:hypothetical protein
MNSDQQTILHYDICSSKSREELVNYINAGIRAGLQPFGFPYTTIQDQELTVHQPMVMYGSKKKQTTKRKL